MRCNARRFGAALAILTAGAVFAARVDAADPGVDLEGSTHVITFTSPPIYDVSIHDSSSNGATSTERAIYQDQKGNIEGVIADVGTKIWLTTNVTGTIRRSGDVTVIKEKEIGDGDLGNGDMMKSRGSKRSVVVEGPTGTTLHSALKIKTCALFKKPFSEKYSKVCSSSAFEHDSPFARSGDWVVRLDLEQSPSGELFGFGKIITNVHSSQFQRETDVIISGDAKDEGLAKMKLSPLFEGGDGPITLVAQINGTQHPAILFVISVKGKLLGQKFAEQYDVLQ
jgi:hypothetical protein